MLIYIKLQHHSVSKEDIGLHFGAVLPAAVSLMLILASPVFASQGLEDLEIGDIYTDEGYVVYFNAQDGAFCFPPPTKLEDSDTLNTVFSERKLYMPYSVYSL